MKKLVIISILFLLSVSTFCQTSEAALIGTWLEYWYPTGHSGDVTSQNRMQIIIDENGDYQIENLDYEYNVFTEIKYDDGILTFIKENTSDPDERFFIYYTLVLGGQGKMMKGGIVNSVQETNPIKWTKIDD